MAFQQHQTSRCTLCCPDGSAVCVCVCPQVALQEAGNAAAAELAVVQQAHAAVMAALEEKLCAQEKHLSAASQQVLELSAQLAVLQGQPRSSRQPPAAPALGADEGSVSLDAGVAPTAHTPSADGGAGVEPANAAASISVSNGGSCGNRQHAELLELLAERDGAVARLESQLAVARAAVDGQADVPGESGADAQVGRRTLRSVCKLGSLLLSASLMSAVGCSLSERLFGSSRLHQPKTFVCAASTEVCCFLPPTPSVFLVCSSDKAPACACALCCTQVLLLQRQLGEALAELQISRERLAEAQAVQVGIAVWA